MDGDATSQVFLLGWIERGEGGAHGGEFGVPAGRGDLPRREQRGACRHRLERRIMVPKAVGLVVQNLLVGWRRDRPVRPDVRQDDHRTARPGGAGVQRDAELAAGADRIDARCQAEGLAQRIDLAHRLEVDRAGHLLAGNRLEGPAIGAAAPGQEAEGTKGGE